MNLSIINYAKKVGIIAGTVTSLYVAGLYMYQLMQAGVHRDVQISKNTDAIIELRSEVAKIQTGKHDIDKQQTAALLRFEESVSAEFRLMNNKIDRQNDKMERLLLLLLKDKSDKE